MIRHASILVLLFASSLCVLQFGFQRFPWDMVGIKFLCTHEPIWLYNTTARADRDCEVDEMKMINRLSVILMRSYYEKRTKISAYIQGTFDPSDRKRMFITIPSAAKAIVQSVTEELMYLSKKLRCAVIRITVLPGPETIYDLRVRNSSLSRGPSRGCKNKFAKLAPTSSGIYESKCQDILSRKIEQQLIIQGKEVPRNGHLR
ncbi:hypothetical protein MTO96_029781 [Rhipicephalus appendiculatus]